MAPAEKESGSFLNGDGMGDKYKYNINIIYIYINTFIHIYINTHPKKFEDLKVDFL